ncbi:HK97-gp10 family putative phage morphogenesis protein [Acidovorax radicis]|uniref:HK97-gp10 family putative phage morphogenesis protein n=1 Tax=Acidovorax radicis TaxID=758826 RepID=UPI001CFB2784|nr:HK97-gp10 family putative phage morphogenesis protein [Acidovorax radicis]UCV00295.1 HK97 gp10 family phage protein [Acidovorax radicis]
MINVAFDFSKIAAKLDGITVAAEKAVRPAAQAGAQIFHDEMRARVPMSAKPHKSGKKTYNPGTLRKAIYQAFADKESGDGKAKYRISWNKTHAFYGRFLEFGTSKMAAKPFLRPAFDAAQAKAVKAVQDRMNEEVKKAIK